MKTASLIKGIEFKENKPTIQVLFETANTKEIRIGMRKGQFMKEHKTPFPIVVEIFDGEIQFGVHGKKYNLKKGDMLALAGDIPHDLNCKSDCIIRLSLSLLDKVERVLDVIK